MIKIDIDTVLIPDTRKIWIVHPGKNKKFYGDFEQNSRIYLEFPGLQLRPNDLKDDAIIRQKIRYSIELQIYKGLTRTDGSQIKLADFATKADSSVAIFLRTVKHLAEHMKAGDLVVVPGYGPYSRLLFGEVVGPFNPALADHIHPYTYAPIQYRQVRWLSRNRFKQELPPELIKYVTKPPAIAEVERNNITDQFFDFAYRSYVKEGESWSTFGAPQYEGNDPVAVITPTRLVAFGVAAYIGIQAGADFSGMSVSDIIDKFYSPEAIEYFGLEFASPGRLNFKAANSNLAIFLSAIIAIGACGALAGCKADASQIQVTNSASQTSIINKDLEGSLNTFVESIDESTLKETDKMAQDATKKVGLETAVKVNP